MRFRPAIVMLFVAVGCQDKKPAGPAAAVETPGPETTAATTATTSSAPVGPGSPPLAGTMDGKAFRPNRVSVDDTPQGPAVYWTFAEERGWADTRNHKDLARRDRFVTARWPGQ